MNRGDGTEGVENEHSSVEDRQLTAGLDEGCLYIGVVLFRNSRGTRDLTKEPGETFKLSCQLSCPQLSYISVPFDNQVLGNILIGIKVDQGYCNQDYCCRYEEPGDDFGSQAAGQEPYQPTNDSPQQQSLHHLKTWAC